MADRRTGARGSRPPAADLPMPVPLPMPLPLPMRQPWPSPCLHPNAPGPSRASQCTVHSPQPTAYSRPTRTLSSVASAHHPAGPSPGRPITRQAHHPAGPSPGRPITRQAHHPAGPSPGRPARPITRQAHHPAGPDAGPCAVRRRAPRGGWGARGCCRATTRCRSAALRGLVAWRAADATASRSMKPRHALLPHGLEPSSHEATPSAGVPMLPHGPACTKASSAPADGGCHGSHGSMAAAIRWCPRQHHVLGPQHMVGHRQEGHGVCSKRHSDRLRP
jgi:hypothetical protein